MMAAQLGDKSGCDLTQRLREHRLKETMNDTTLNEVGKTLLYAFKV